MIFSGTHCLVSDSLDSTGGKALGLVLQTGFNTSKGLLIRSIMFGKSELYRFERDGNIFLLVLICLSLVFIVVYYILAYSGGKQPEFSEIWLPSIDIMLTMVPPGLTLCLSIGVQYAQQRLAKKKISAMKTRLINAAGRMKICLFDKTGTLTTNDVCLDSVLCFDPDVDNQECVELQKDSLQENPKFIAKNLLRNFATNHTLVNFGSKSDEGSSTRILGDPLEIELFEFNSAEFCQSKETSGQSSHMKTFKATIGKERETLGVRQVFSFKSELQRMSVIVDCMQIGETYSFVKGAPERILELSEKSTLPQGI